MKKFTIIFKKEIKDLTRDKRTLLTMIIIPLLLFPVLLNITGSIAKNQDKNEKEKQLSVGIIGKDNAKDLVTKIENLKGVKVTYFKNTIETDTLIKSGKLDGALFFENDFEAHINSLSTGTIVLYYKSQNYGVKDRLMQVISIYKASLTHERLTQLKITNASIDPLEVKIEDVSTKREVLGQTIGGFIPYIFVIFTYLGCIYPAIDLFTNEKEKGTIETLLSSPAGRLEILFAKMSVVACIGLISALLSIVGLSFGIHNLAQGLPAELTDTLGSFIRPENVALIFAMLLPLTVFLASLLTILTTYAKTYKEAQTILSPLAIIIIIPAVIGLMPGIALNIKTAIIPITNISLATKEIIAGTINPFLYILVLGSLLVYAAIGVYVSSLWYSKEVNIIK